MGAVANSICCIKDNEIIEQLGELQSRNALSNDFRSRKKLLPQSEMIVEDPDLNSVFQKSYSHLEKVPISSEVIITQHKGNPKENYEILKKIGEGAFGEVFIARNKITGVIRALKQIEKNKTVNDSSLQNEILVLKKLNHPYIVKLFEFYSDNEDDYYYLISEFCSDGDLAGKLKKIGRFPEYFVRIIMRQIFIALMYLNNNEVIHGDLKLENILIDYFGENAKKPKDGYLKALIHDAKELNLPDFENIILKRSSTIETSSREDININDPSCESQKFVFHNKLAKSAVTSKASSWGNIQGKNLEFENYRIKFIDFGCSKMKTAFKKRFHDLVGTLLYCAPEVLADNYDEKMDIWSCGVIMYQLLKGSTPFDGKNEEEITEKIINTKIDLDEENWSDDAKDLIKKCLTRNVLNRITIEEALNHPFVKIESREFTEKEIKILLNLKEETLKSTRILDNYQKMKSNIMPLLGTGLDDIRQKNKKNIIKRMVVALNSKQKDNSEIEEAKIIGSKLYQLVLTYLSYNFDDKPYLRELADLFDLIDTKKIGKLSGNDLFNAFVKAKIDITYNETLDIIKYLDFNNNQFIEYEEFIRMCLPKEILFSDANLEQAFRLLDRDNNGTIVPEEVKAALGIEKSGIKDFEVMGGFQTEEKGITFEQFKKRINILFNKK